MPPLLFLPSPTYMASPSHSRDILDKLRGFEWGRETASAPAMNTSKGQIPDLQCLEYGGAKARAVEGRIVRIKHQEAVQQWRDFQFSQRESF